VFAVHVPIPHPNNTMTDQTASNGTILGGFLIPMFHGTDAVIFGWLIAGMWLLGAIVMIIRYGPRNHRRSRSRLRLSQQEKANNIPCLDADMENRETGHNGREGDQV
jgi:hypothetical protein